MHFHEKWHEMRLAFSVYSGDPDAAIGAPFGRCPAYVIVDTETGRREVVHNPTSAANEGAGVQAAELIIRHHVDAVVGGLYGSRAAEVLKEANVVMFRATEGTISEFLNR